VLRVLVETVLGVENPAARAERVVAVRVDGREAVVADGAARVPLAADGALHEVRVELGG
jgi:hypothetical protein